MPKKVQRNNPRVQDRRPVHSAAVLLQRIGPQVFAASGSSGKSPALARLRSQLPAELSPHLLNVLEKEHELVCFVDSAAWAGRLRLALADLADPDRRALRIRVMPRGGYRP